MSTKPEAKVERVRSLNKVYAPEQESMVAPTLLETTFIARPTAIFLYPNMQTSTETKNEASEVANLEHGPERVFSASAYAEQKLPELAEQQDTESALVRDLVKHTAEKYSDAIITEPTDYQNETVNILNEDGHWIARTSEGDTNITEMIIATDDKVLIENHMALISQLQVGETTFADFKNEDGQDIHTGTTSDFSVTKNVIYLDAYRLEVSQENPNEKIIHVRALQITEAEEPAPYRLDESRHSLPKDVTLVSADLEFIQFESLGQEQSKDTTTVQSQAATTEQVKNNITNSSTELTNTKVDSHFLSPAPETQRNKAAHEEPKYQFSFAASILGDTATEKISPIQETVTLDNHLAATVDSLTDPPADAIDFYTYEPSNQLLTSTPTESSEAQVRKSNPDNIELPAGTDHAVGKVIRDESKTTINFTKLSQQESQVVSAPTVAVEAAISIQPDQTASKPPESQPVITVDTPFITVKTSLQENLLTITGAAREHSKAVTFSDSSTSIENVGIKEQVQTNIQEAGNNTVHESAAVEITELDSQYIVTEQLPHTEPQQYTQPHGAEITSSGNTPDLNPVHTTRPIQAILNRAANKTVEQSPVEQNTKTTTLVVEPRKADTIPLSPVRITEVSSLLVETPDSVLADTIATSILLSSTKKVEHTHPIPSASEETIEQPKTIFDLERQNFENDQKIMDIDHQPVIQGIDNNEVDSAIQNLKLPQSAEHALEAQPIRLTREKTRSAPADQAPTLSRTETSIQTEPFIRITEKHTLPKTTVAERPTVLAVDGEIPITPKETHKPSVQYSEYQPVVSLKSKKMAVPDTVHFTHDTTIKKSFKNPEPIRPSASVATEDKKVFSSLQHRRAATRNTIVAIRHLRTVAAKANNLSTLLGLDDTNNPVIYTDDPAIVTQTLQMAA